MNKSDKLIYDAVLSKTDTEFNKRSVSNNENLTVIKLHGQTCLEIDRENKTITINGDTPTTRKSCRLINTVLGSLSSGRVLSRNGEWFYENGQEKTPFTNRNLTVLVTS